MHARRVACATLLLAAAATACSSNDGEPKTITVTKTVTASPDTKAATNADNGVMKIGTKKTINDTENDLRITAQVLDYQQPYKGPQPQKPEDFQGGDTWATASVKVCNVGSTGITVDQSVWSLAYADGTSIEITGSTGGDMPKPEYPMNKAVKPGRCAAGLIAFPVPSSKRPERIVYEPEGSEPTEWAVSKS